MKSPFKYSTSVNLLSNFTLLLKEAVTSSRSRGVGHAPGAPGGRGLEVGRQSPRGHVVGGRVVGEDVGGLGGVRPRAAVPRPPVGLAGGLGGQVLRDVLHRVWGGWT